jgi:site-specific DNA recombinase
MLILIRGLAKLGKEIHTLDRGQLKSDTIGMIISLLDAKSAGDERRKIIERTTRGRSHKATSGHVVGMGKAPYGYRYVKDVKDSEKTTMLEIDESQAAVVRMIFEWYTLGREGKRIGATLIARELYGLGIPTPSEAGGYKRKRTAAAGVWGEDMIFWILKSETYKGLWRFGKYIGGGGRGGKRDLADTVTVNVPAIVSEETWNAAQAQRTANSKHVRQHGQRYYLLTGLTKCECGHVYSGSNGRYVCSSSTNLRRHYAEKKCHEPSIKAEKLETLIWDYIRTLVKDPDQLQQRLRAARDLAYDALKPKRDELAIVEEMIAEVEADAADIAQALIEARGRKLVVVRLQAQAQDVDERHAKLTTRRDALSEEINRATLTDAEIETMAQFHTDVFAGIDEATPERKRRWLELLNVRIKIAGGQVEVTCLISQNGLPRVLELQEVRGSDAGGSHRRWAESLNFRSNAKPPALTTAAQVDAT